MCHTALKFEIFIVSSFLRKGSKKKIIPALPINSKDLIEPHVKPFQDLWNQNWPLEKRAPRGD